MRVLFPSGSWWRRKSRIANFRWFTVEDLYTITATSQRQFATPTKGCTVHLLDLDTHGVPLFVCDETINFFLGYSVVHIFNQVVYND